VLLQSLI